MKYAILASNEENIYKVKKYEATTGLTKFAKPTFTPCKIDNWKVIREFECDKLNLRNTNSCSWDTDDYVRLLLSETEEVKILKEVFRIDKVSMYVYTDKILSTKEDRTTNWQEYQDALVEYRDYIISKHPKVKEYCRIHTLTNELEDIDNIVKLVNDTNLQNCAKELKSLVCGFPVTSANITLDIQ